MNRKKMFGRLLVSLAAALAVMFGFTGVASATPANHAASASSVRPADTGATLTGATITFFTLDDDKDGNTLLHVQVLDSSNRIAALTNGFFGLFPDQSTNGPFTLSRRSGVLWDSLLGGNVRISIQPNGNDTWKFGYELDLTFSDGSFVPTFNSRVVLSQSNQTWTEPIQF